MNLSIINRLLLQSQHFRSDRDFRMLQLFCSIQRIIRNGIFGKTNYGKSMALMPHSMNTQLLNEQSRQFFQSGNGPVQNHIVHLCNVLWSIYSSIAFNWDFWNHWNHWICLLVIGGAHQWINEPMTGRMAQSIQSLESMKYYNGINDLFAFATFAKTSNGFESFHMFNIDVRQILLYFILSFPTIHHSFIRFLSYGIARNIVFE